MSRPLTTAQARAFGPRYEAKQRAMNRAFKGIAPAPQRRQALIAIAARGRAKR